jgi:beta-lactamase class A
VKRSILIVIIFVFTFTTGAFAITNFFGLTKTDKTVREKLSREIAEYIKDFHGEVGVYIKDLKTGMIITYNEDKVFASASLAKIPLMAAMYRALNDGVVSYDEKLVMKRKYRVSGPGKFKYARSGKKFDIDDVVKHMIIESDNTATNLVSDRLGFNYINWCFRQFELKKTNFDRAILDIRKRDYFGIDNYTTAREMGKLLEDIYYGKLINETISKKMLLVLCQQKINDRIPRFLPKSYVIAHKTGLNRNVCHDAGIVFTDKTDFIICVLTSDFSSNYKYAKKFIGNIAYTTSCSF